MKFDVSDIGRDPHGLTTDFCVQISVVGVARVFHHNSFLSFILVLELYWNSSHLSFCCPTTIPFLPPELLRWYFTVWGFIILWYLSGVRSMMMLYVKSLRDNTWRHVTRLSECVSMTTVNECGVLDFGVSDSRHRSCMNCIALGTDIILCRHPLEHGMII